MPKFGLYVPPRTGLGKPLTTAEEWARSLKDTEVRELASEYLRGDKDPAARDAWTEYCRRFPDELDKPGTPHTKAKRRK